MEDSEDGDIGEGGGEGRREALGLRLHAVLLPCPREMNQDRVRGSRVTAPSCLQSEATVEGPPSVTSFYGGSCRLGGHVPAGPTPREASSWVRVLCMLMWGAVGVPVNARVGRGPPSSIESRPGAGLPCLG